MCMFCFILLLKCHHDMCTFFLLHFIDINISSSIHFKLYLEFNRERKHLYNVNIEMRDFWFIKFFWLLIGGKEGWIMWKSLNHYDFSSNSQHLFLIVIIFGKFSQCVRQFWVLSLKWKAGLFNVFSVAQL